MLWLFAKWGHYWLWMYYVSPNVCGFYISYETMVGLLMLDRHFPTIGGHPQKRNPCPTSNPPSTMDVLIPRKEHHASAHKEHQCLCDPQPSRSYLFQKIFLRWRNRYLTGMLVQHLIPALIERCHAWQALQMLIILMNLLNKKHVTHQHPYQFTGN